MFDGSLIMSSHILSSQSYISACVNSHRLQFQSRLNPVQAIPPSSILLHTDESEHFPESKKGSGFDPVSKKSKDSTGFDSGPVVESLQSKRAFLEKSGARCIVMPCHVSHLWYEKVSKRCPVTFLHMADCVAKELKEAKLKPLEAGSLLRIGLLATNAILTAGFYQEKLENEGFEVVILDKVTMEHTVIPAIEALDRKDIEGARNLLRIALQVLLVRAVNSIILASDDMRDLLPQDDPLLMKCIDPMDALARSTINWAQSIE